MTILIGAADVSSDLFLDAAIDRERHKHIETMIMIIANTMNAIEITLHIMVFSSAV